MNWRLNEGRGECVYMVGYEDDGKATGVPPYDLNASIKTLKVMMQAVGAKISKMEVRSLPGWGGKDCGGGGAGGTVTKRNGGVTVP